MFTRLIAGRRDLKTVGFPLPLAGHERFKLLPAKYAEDETIIHVLRQAFLMLSRALGAHLLRLAAC